jgi:acyl-CoA thioesterase FadM
MGDVDAVQVYAPNYFRWMDLGLDDLFVALGHPLAELITAGFGTPAVNAQCSYASAIGLGDTLEWTTRISRVGTSSFDVTHDFRCAGRHVARGVMTHVWVEIRGSQRPAQAPDWLREAVTPAAPDPVRLPGVPVSECPNCARLAYPPEGECLMCGRTPAAFRSGAAAELVTWTRVHQAPPGFTAPYVLAWAQLVGLPVAVLGRLAPGDDLRDLRRGQSLHVSMPGELVGQILLEVAT